SFRPNRSSEVSVGRRGSTLRRAGLWNRRRRMPVRPLCSFHPTPLEDTTGNPWRLVQRRSCCTYLQGRPLTLYMPPMWPGSLIRGGKIAVSTEATKGPCPPNGSRCHLHREYSSPGILLSSVRCGALPILSWTAVGY